MNEDLHGSIRPSTIKGGKIVVNEKKERNMKGPIIDSLDKNQLMASNENADLRKKLRIDRVRKMTLGQSAMTASVEDTEQPDWVKIKSLRDIEMIRETKKNDIVNQLLGNSSMNTETISVVPGRTSVVKFPLINDGNMKEVFRFHVRDPDEDLLMQKD